MTAFTRGLMLGEDLTEVARRMGDDSLTRAYLEARDSAGKRFAAAFLPLHRPEARPYYASGIIRQAPAGKLDPYRDNWWCPMNVEGALDSRANWEWGVYLSVPAPVAAGKAAFLDGGAEAEAANFLGGIVFEYARAHGDDASVPEALYWLVRAGHYGCADPETWKTTRAAFRLLHRR